MARLLMIGLALLALAAAGCGGDDDETTGATGATGASSAGDDVAADADARAAVRTAQVTLEALATDNNGSYDGIDAADAAELEPALADADLTVTGDETTYTVEVTSASGTEFSITRDENGKIEHTCSAPGVGACSASGDWD